MKNSPATGKKYPELNKKPLGEAIIELHWKLEGTGDSQRDPAYPLYSGRLFDLIKDNFPFAEELPSARIPDEISPHMVKMRFRASANGWPVVQVGPGVLTLNETENYTESAFYTHAIGLLPKFIEAYKYQPNQPNPVFSAIIMRYINTYEFDYRANDVLEFLSKKLHTTISLPKNILQSDGLSGPAGNLNLQIGLPLKVPVGAATLKIATGTRESKRALVWELFVKSSGKNVPQDPDGYKLWLEQAHAVVEEWFFSLIEGDLFEEFK